MIITKYHGCKYEVDIGEHIGGCFYFFSEYEPLFESCLSSLLKEKNPNYFLDIGANIGTYTVWSAKYVNHVYAFEPSPTIRERLNKNIELNHLNNVTVVDKAVSDTNGESCFFTNLRPDNMGVGKIFRAGYEREEELKIVVETITLDSFFEKYVMEGVGVIKIDVEGAELKVIEGGVDVLSKDKAPTLLIEVHPQELEMLGDSQVALVKTLETYKYTVHDISDHTKISAVSLNSDYYSKHFSIICTKE
ncbi:MAG: FkbM family methyltransferase [Candidatus Roizmanbacteria bacterium]|nr:FkbM family methyltransferase [Candidatus Roizmanbacteria bacterium]